MKMETKKWGLFHVEHIARNLDYKREPYAPMDASDDGTKR